MTKRPLAAPGSTSDLHLAHSPLVYHHPLVSPPLSSSIRPVPLGPWNTENQFYNLQQKEYFRYFWYGMASWNGVWALPDQIMLLHQPTTWPPISNNGLRSCTQIKRFKILRKIHLSLLFLQQTWPSRCAEQSHEVFTLCMTCCLLQTWEGNKPKLNTD